MAELLQRPIKYGNLFDMSEASAPVLADNIASAVKAQLDFIRENRHFAGAYRLELSPPNPDLPNQWRVDLLLHPVAWYIHLQNTNADESVVLETAHNYVEHLRSKVRRAWKLTKPEADSEEPVKLAKYCDGNRSCHNHPARICDECHQKVLDEKYCGDTKRLHKLCSKPHVPYICGQEIEQSDGSKQACRMYIMQELLLFTEKESKPRYMMAARRELVRELLVIPTDHLTNEDIVTDVGVWEFVIKAMHTELKVEGILPIEKIAINFGEWETAQAINKYAQGCHGHIHLQLTKSAHRTLKRKYAGLVGRTGDSKDYSLENCQVLESTWLLSSFASVSFRKLGKLENDVRILKDDVRILKDDVRILKDDVRILKEDVRILKDDVRILKDDVRILKDDVRILKEDVQGLKEDMRDVKRLLQPENFVPMLKEALQSLHIAG